MPTGSRNRLGTFISSSIFGLFVMKTRLIELVAMPSSSSPPDWQTLAEPIEWPCRSLKPRRRGPFARRPIGRPPFGIECNQMHTDSNTHHRDYEQRPAMQLPCLDVVATSFSPTATARTLLGTSATGISGLDNAVAIAAVLLCVRPIHDKPEQE